MNNPFAHFVGLLSSVVLIGTLVLENFRWLPVHNVWAADMTGTVVAILGSIYASRNGSRWWYVLTGCSSFIFVLLIVALGG